MQNDALTVIVASSAVVADDDLARFDLAAAGSELLEEILSQPRVEAMRRPRARRARAAAALVAAAAVVGAVAVQATRRERATAWADELVAVAEASPRLIVDLPNWRVSRADEFDGANGEMTFADGASTLDLRWQPPRSNEDLVKDRADSAGESQRITVLGHDAVLFRYAGTTDYTTLWTDDHHSLEARGAFPSINQYRAVLDHLRQVDADAWLSAMPDSVIKPAEQAAIVDRMLADIPRPDGFAFVVPSGAVHDRYQLGAAVSGQVACRWIESWIAARASGDAAAVARATAAMATSHRWTVLKEMDADGDYPEVLWEYADAMQTVGQTRSITDSYRSALGCP